MAYRIRSSDPSPLLENGKTVGKYLMDVDVDARGGRGRIAWTNDPRCAMIFLDQGEAFACWRRQSTVTPLRDDGSPNRPLSAWTVTIEIIP